MDCDICQVSFDKKERKPISVSCGHTICSSCLNKWKKESKTCPTCRQKITGKTPVNYYLIGLLDKTQASDSQSAMKRDINNQIKEVEKIKNDVDLKCNQKLEEIKTKTDSIKSAISEKVSELINQILSRQDILNKEADRIQNSLNQQVNSILNVEQIGQVNCETMEMLELERLRKKLNETKKILCSNQKLFNNINFKMEFKFDEENIYNIGAFKNMKKKKNVIRKHNITSTEDESQDEDAVEEDEAETENEDEHGNEDEDENEDEENEDEEDEDEEDEDEENQDEDEIEEVEEEADEDDDDEADNDEDDDDEDEDGAETEDDESDENENLAPIRSASKSGNSWFSFLNPKRTKK